MQKYNKKTGCYIKKKEEVDKCASQYNRKATIFENNKVIQKINGLRKKYFH